jgi:hypothetical protein
LCFADADAASAGAATGAARVMAAADCAEALIAVAASIMQRERLLIMEVPKVERSKNPSVRTQRFAHHDTWTEAG